LDGVSFQRFVGLRGKARWISCTRTRFLAGGHLELGLAQVSCEEAEFPSPFIVSGDAQSPPSIVSLRRANVYSLVLNGTDLRRCRFAGTHNLDRLRIEGVEYLANSPSGWKFGRVGGQGLPIWRWTRRQVLAEEHEWRWLRPFPSSPAGRIHPKRQDWYPDECKASTWFGPQGKLEPEEITSLYRALRKGREDNKDEPGAADFYYGEMEMRRKARSTPWPERIILFLYWLLAGYGLRAARAFLALSLALIVATALIATIGIPPPRAATLSGSITGTPPSQRVTLESGTSNRAAETSSASRLRRAFRVSIEAALFRSPDQQLTALGRDIQTMLRLIGPILLALAILSIRGRVKR
jgi:hypothetical protein